MRVSTNAEMQHQPDKDKVTRNEQTTVSDNHCERTCKGLQDEDETKQNGDKSKVAIHTSSGNTQNEEKKEDELQASSCQNKNESDIISSDNNNSSTDTDVETSSSPLPIVSLCHGLSCKANPFLVKNWIAMSLTLDGRDKITKFLQYISRLMAWWLVEGRISTIHGKRFHALYKGTAQSRKAFRIGRSIVELEKLRTMGLVSLILWHLRRSLIEADDDSKQPQQKVRLVRSASSNVGWGPSTISSHTDRNASRSSSFYRSLSNIGSRMYRPLKSQLSSLGPASQPTAVPLWKVVGMSIKLLGLLGFWAADNVNFLSSTGFLDNFSVDEKKRLSKRKQMQGKAARWGARSYFAGAVAGLIVNLKSYLTFRRTVIKNSQDQLNKLIQTSQCEDKNSSCEYDTDNNALIEKLKQNYSDARKKQFQLFLALLKSCCDVIVFSNNPGVDLHKKYRGRKMNEGFHCLCGLLSASTVLYNNFPNSD